jgi:hypothetical protein
MKITDIDPQEFIKVDFSSSNLDKLNVPFPSATIFSVFGSAMEKM